jgi:RHS repeat-associated protein
MALTVPVLNVTALTESGGDPVITKYFFFGGKRVAMDREDVVQWLVGDHLGSTSLVLNANGTVHSEARHYPYGEERWRWPQEGTFPTEYRFTGQRQESGLGLYFMGARQYDPYINRFISPDPIIPQPGNPQSLNRYSYVYNRPLTHVDSSGHIPIPVIIGVGVLILKAIDYGWTAWDTYQSGRVLTDPNASRSDKMLAGLNIALSVGLEAVEPDDFLPTSLPIDDVARKALMKGAKESLEAGGEEGLQIFIRKNLGDHADDVLRRLDMGHSIDPSQLLFSDKITDQLGRRGWTRQGIEELIGNPALTRKNPGILNRATGNPVTYFYRADGYYVVVDDISGEIVQISNTFDPNWIDEMTNAPVTPVW